MKPFCTFEPLKQSQIKNANAMKVGSKEFYEMMQDFERSIVTIISVRLDREEYSQWSKGNVYQHGEVNKLWKVFELGYSTARCDALLGAFN